MRYLEEIADFDLPEGTQYRIVTTKNMNALTAIYALLQNHEPEEIIIAIYRMNQPAVVKIIGNNTNFGSYSEKKNTCV